mmetsp:Transcript_33950/g.66278  ORF Transcript_33950/g.66278 Transcript_33950/m.66278 type:complete len:210 (+) Transcript_33950:277-906(+)
MLREGLLRIAPEGAVSPSTSGRSDSCGGGWRHPPCAPRELGSLRPSGQQQLLSSEPSESCPAVACPHISSARWSGGHAIIGLHGKEIHPHQSTPSSTWRRRSRSRWMRRSSAPCARSSCISMLLRSTSRTPPPPRPLSPRSFSRCPANTASTERVCSRGSRSATHAPCAAARSSRCAAATTGGISASSRGLSASRRVSSCPAISIPFPT